MQEGKNVHKNIKIEDKDIKHQKNSDEKEIDYFKNVNLKLHKFLNY